jgi:hypothetical protein
MSDRVESASTIAAAMLVLFTTLPDPRISAILAVIALMGSGTCHFVKSQITRRFMAVLSALIVVLSNGIENT